jgi:hypothetical protein
VAATAFVGLVGCGQVAENADPVEETSAALTTNLKINCGGSATTTTGGVVPAIFITDTDFSGNSSTLQSSATITTTGVPFPAPASVYQTARTGTFTYLIGGFGASTPHSVRLHFADNWSTAMGQRQFNVLINGTNVLPSFDVFKTAGGRSKPNVQEFVVNASTNGSYTIVFSPVSPPKGSPIINGIEVTPPNCGVPSTPTNGKSTYTKTTAGGVATYSCNSGFWLNGDKTRTCGTDGLWSSLDPQCDLKGNNGAPCLVGEGFECKSNLCPAGICVDSLCNGPCDTSSFVNGVCQHKAAGALCKTITGSNPGNNDFQLFCTSQHACVGPTFTCGDTGTSCTADGNTACCQRPIVDSSGTTTWTQTECGAANTCAGNYGENCRSNRDCPTNQFCCFDGGYGFGWSVCHTTACPAGRQECRDASDVAGCAGVPGTTCQNYNGTDFTCM